MTRKANYNYSLLERQLNDPDAIIEPIEKLVAEKVHPILVGQDVPPLPYDDLNKERWMIIMEYIIGVHRIFASSAIADITGLSFSTTSKLIDELKIRWSKTLTPAQANSRREALYQECERIKALAWDEVQVNDKDKVAYMKLIIEAQKRQATLCGLDKLEIAIEQITTEKKELAIDASPETLAQIGLMLAKTISSQKRINDE
jgi:hypothetical protein